VLKLALSRRCRDFGAPKYREAFGVRVLQHRFFEKVFGSEVRKSQASKSGLNLLWFRTLLLEFRINS
jgi:hypothetical protein